MPSFGDSIFLFILALLLFGPKKLPVLAREIGKWVGEFRRASNEFKMQMEDELRQTEQEERLKKIEAMEAAAPKTAELPETTETTVASEAAATPPMSEEAAREWATHDGVAAPLPIAEAGEVKIMPPATGLPSPRKSTRQSEGNALGGLLDAIPAAEKNGAATPTTGEEATHEWATQGEKAEAAHGH